MRNVLFSGSTVTIATLATTALAENIPSSLAQPNPPLRLAGALLFVIVVLGAVWLRARRTTLLKDNLLPQIAPAKQPYSLGRWQMAFWFTLIFLAFIAIYIVTGQYDGIITPQALWLMGISAVSGVSSVAVDVIKDSPSDAANRGLQALGLQTYADVERVRQEITQREEQLKANPPQNVAQQLSLEIRDRRLLLTAYDNAIRPFVSEGWYKDITTDLNGAALHRVQTLAWTLALGLVFVVSVINSIAAHAAALPQFDSQLLLLLGISNAGYIGFKYPEPQQ